MKKRRDKVKEAGDKKLVALVEKIQNQIALQQDLDHNTLDMSDDNVIAKYSFLYSEARHRHTRFSGITNAITQ